MLQNYMIDLTDQKL